jgi:hypothetical protein
LELIAKEAEPALKEVIQEHIFALSTVITSTEKAMVKQGKKKKIYKLKYF